MLGFGIFKQGWAVLELCHLVPMITQVRVHPGRLLLRSKTLPSARLLLVMALPVLGPSEVLRTARTNSPQPQGALGPGLALGLGGAVTALGREGNLENTAPQKAKKE